MTTLREAAQQALDALESDPCCGGKVNNAIDALRDALAQPESEPVAYVPLTDAEIDNVLVTVTQNRPFGWREYGRAIEQAVRGKT